MGTIIPKTVNLKCLQELHSRSWPMFIFFLQSSCPNTYLHVWIITIMEMNNIYHVIWKCDIFIYQKMSDLWGNILYIIGCGFSLPIFCSSWLKHSRDAISVSTTVKRTKQNLKIEIHWNINLNVQVHQFSKMLTKCSALGASIMDK